MAKVSTIAIAALDELEFRSELKGTNVRPGSLAEHVDWEELGMQELPVGLSGPRLHLDGAGADGDARLFWISPFGRLVIFRWSWQIGQPGLNALDWPRHWQDSWSVLEESWPQVAAHLRLPDQEWLFAFSIVEGDEEEITPFLPVVRGLSDGNGHLSHSGVSASIGWDGGLVARIEERCRTELDAIVAIAAVASLRWQNDNHALRRIRGMLRQSGGRDVLDRQTASITRLARKVYDGQTTLDSDTLCVYGSDELIARAFSQGWSMDRLTARANDAIHRLTHANELDTRIQSRESARAQERWLLLLALVGLCGTLAGVLSAVDFRNAIISSEGLRGVLIAIGTVLIGGATLWNASRRRR